MTPRGRRTTALAVGAALGLTGGGVLAVAAPWAAHPGSLLRPPAAAAAALPAFESCARLRDWYVGAALREVGPWGLSGPPLVYAAGPGGVRPEWGPVGTGLERTATPAVSARGDGGQATSGQAASSTGTNVQEAGVDESDTAKTDGHLVVRLDGDSLVVTDVSGTAAEELSRTALPGPSLSSPELLLHDGRVTVVGEHQQFHAEPWGGPMRPGRIALSPAAEPTTRLLAFDLATPSSPRLVSERSVDGDLLSAREYADGTVRVVTTTARPRISFVHPSEQLTPAAATRANRQLLRAAPLSAWLPRVASPSGGPRGIDCTAVRHPTTPSGFGTIAVLTLPQGAGSSKDVRSTAVVASGDLVYSSARRLYVGTTGWDPHSATTLHAFALDGSRTTYVASGVVPGSVRDRWSLSEHDGHLRAAVATGSGADAQNAVVVLAERGNRLVRTGEVDGLGRGEQVQAVRWLGDVAVVVTYRRTDPVYTLDLADPARPRLLGALHLPGFSSYLHPVGGGLLVGLGRDATLSGEDRGGQAATFALGDLAHVRRLHTLRMTYTDGALLAASDPRAFTWLPDRHTFLTTVTSWAGWTERTAPVSGQAFVAVHVAGDGSLTRTATWPATATVDLPRALPLPGGRVALVDGDGVRVVAVP